MNLSEFEPDDLLSFQAYRDRSWEVEEEKIIRASQFIQGMDAIWQNKIPHSFSEALITMLGLKVLGCLDWFREGVDCAVLKLGSKNWCKGKLRISIAIDFIPDQIDTETQTEKITDEQAESPLDEIRQMMNDGQIDEWS